MDFESEDYRITCPPYHVIWKQMELLVTKGLVKSIGVSNCTIPMMIDLLAYAEIKPVINQVEMHPYLNQAEVLRFHRKWGIVLEGYSPIGGEGGNVLDDAVLAEIATSKGKSPAQVCLAWHVKRGTVPLPKTARVERLP